MLRDATVPSNSNQRQLPERWQAEAEWQRTFDSVPHAIFVLDGENRIQRANRAAVEATGCELSQMFGKHCYEVIHQTSEPAAYCPHQALLRSCQGGRGELVEPRLDKIFDMTCSPVRDEQGILLGSVHVLSDITERKRAEEGHAQLVAVLEATSDLVGLADPSGKATYCNGNGRKMLGLAKNEDVTRYNVETFHAPRYKRLLREEAIPTAVQTGIWKGESALLTLGGVEIPVSQVLLAHKAPDGSTRFLSTIARDITESKRAEEKIRHQLARLAALRAIDTAITASLDVHVSLSVFLDQVTTQLDVDAADILLLSPHSQMLEFASGRGFKSASHVRLHVPLVDEPPGRAVLERRVITIPNLEGALGKFADASTLASEGFVSYIATPLISKGQVTGVLEVWHRRPLEPNLEWLEFLDALAGQGAIAVDNAALYQQLQISNSELILAYDSTLEGWVKALDMRDNETEGHTRRVTDLAVRLAHDYPVDKDLVTHIRRGALLHDIGKMAVPDAILHKPGPLSPEEWEIMKRHPAYAYEWLSPIPYLRPALDIPYCHHEKWDGSGYPRGLQGEGIPLAARLFAVVDVWDALRSDRPYRPGWSKDKVLAYFSERAGHDFDPYVVEVFLKHAKNYP
jgi:PAS domain S-box-containing protein/putative nucleotidyltransferase with HDIG domain